MASCKDCKNFHPIPEDALDYKPDKGKYWKAKPTDGDHTGCACFVQKI